MEDDEDDDLELDPIGAAYDRHAIAVHPRRTVGVVRNAHMHQVRNQVVYIRINEEILSL